MRFNDIGEKLRAFRLQSGLRAEEIAARLGVSRAALYRYEKGDVVKIETVKRMAELLNISSSSLLGAEYEYYTHNFAFQRIFEGLLNDADSVIFVGNAVCPLLLSRGSVAFINKHIIAGDQPAMYDGGNLRSQVRRPAGALQGMLRAAGSLKSVTFICDRYSIEFFLTFGINANTYLDADMREDARSAAKNEMIHLANIAKDTPMGTQIGVLASGRLSMPFCVIESRDVIRVCIAPFPLDTVREATLGVATVTSAEKAVRVHREIAETAWSNSLKGHDAACFIDQMISRFGIQ